jgi:hypothetical protein
MTSLKLRTRILVLTTLWLRASFLDYGGFATAKNTHDAIVSRRTTLAAFQVSSHRRLHRPTKTVLRMGGFSKARSKQAELSKKAEAKTVIPAPDTNSLENEESSSSTTSPNKDNSNQNNNQNNNNNKDIVGRVKETQDRELFAKLLSTTRGAIPTDKDTDAAFILPMTAGKTKAKIKQKPPPSLTKVEKPPSAKELQQKQDEAKTSQRVHFESLVDVVTSRPLGAIGAAQLVPWVPPYLTDCLIVLVDPRANSGDLRQALKYVTSNLQQQQQQQQQHHHQGNDKDGRDEKDAPTSTSEGSKVKNKRLRDQVIFISADSVEETKS